MIICGDARHIPLPDGSVQCCLTSVPYWGLRRYSSDSGALIGLEATLDEWLQNLVAVFWEALREGWQAYLAEHYGIQDAH